MWQCFYCLTSELFKSPSLKRHFRYNFHNKIGSKYKIHTPRKCYIATERKIHMTMACLLRSENRYVMCNWWIAWSHFVLSAGITHGDILEVIIINIWWLTIVNDVKSPVNFVHIFHVILLGITVMITNYIAEYFRSYIHYMIIFICVDYFTFSSRHYGKYDTYCNDKIWATAV